MKKLLSIAAAGIILAVSVTACGSSGSSGTAETAAASEETQAAAAAESESEPVTLRLGHTNAETDSRQTMVLKFKELVEERSGGSITIDIYAGGTLGNGVEEMEALKLGTQDILVEGYNYINMYSEYAQDTIPFLYDGYDHFMACWYESDVAGMWEKYATDVGYTVFAPSYRGFRVVTSAKPFSNAEEVKGLKIRVPNGDIWSRTWQTLDAQPTPMDLSEVITGIQQGTVEAQENPVLMSYNYGFADVCDYLIRTNHVCGADIFIMDSARFGKLSAEQQEIITEAAIECAKEISEYNYNEEENYIKKFEEKGVTVIDPDHDSFQAAFTNFVPDYYPELTEIYNAVRAVEY